MNFYNPYQNVYGVPAPNLTAPVNPRPMYPEPQYPVQQNGGMLWVRSQAEAESYMMAPNSAVTLWDSSAPAVYVKKTDATGRAEFKAYDLVERTAARPAPVSTNDKYLTREEFDEFVRRITPTLGNGKYSTKEDAE